MELYYNSMIKPTDYKKRDVLIIDFRINSITLNVNALKKISNVANKITNWKKEVIRWLQCQL